MVPGELLAFFATEVVMFVSSLDRHNLGSMFSLYLMQLLEKSFEKEKMDEKGLLAYKVLKYKKKQRP